MCDRVILICIGFLPYLSYFLFLSRFTLMYKTTMMTGECRRLDISNDISRIFFSFSVWRIVWNRREKERLYRTAKKKYFLMIGRSIDQSIRWYVIGSEDCGLKFVSEVLWWHPISKKEGKNFGGPAAAPRRVLVTSTWGCYCNLPVRFPSSSYHRRIFIFTVIFPRTLENKEKN